MDTELIKKLNEYKMLLSERARRNYQKRKEEGREKKIKPAGEHKKRGRPKKNKEILTEEKPQQLGRKPQEIIDISTAPAYLLKIL